MRRSAAPSIRADIKRARFLPQIFKNISPSDKENEHNSISSNSPCLQVTKPEIKASTETLRSDKDVLDLLFDIDTPPGNTIKEQPQSGSSDVVSRSEKNATNNFSNTFQTSLKPTKRMKEGIGISAPNANVVVGSKNLSNCIYCIKVEEEAALFNVVWCKRSGKKHKTWEGDGLLIVKSRSAVLKDTDGKILDKGLGYKLKETEALEEGSKFFIGGKECEIQYKISEEECKSGKFCKCNPKDEEVKQLPEESVSNYKPSILKSWNNVNLLWLAPKLLPVSNTVTASKLFLLKSSTYYQIQCKLVQVHTFHVTVECPKAFNNIVRKFYSPIAINLKSQSNEEKEEHTFILPSPTEDKQMGHNPSGRPITNVYVDSFLTKQLRSHQKEGISFMYKCIMGFQHEFGQGVILADEMGLGKTLQCIALIWTLYKRGPYGGLPVLKNVIIITPSSLVTNWLNEFHKWLGKARLPIFAVNQKNTVKDFVKCPKSVLIISYEMFLRSAKMLSSVAFDLVICDEGHRIKNLNIKISNVINCLSTTRRILLTGTPIQNDLAEFFSIVDFANPGALGTLQYFRKTFEKPISQSRNQECGESEREYGEEKSEELGNMAKMFMLRRTQEVINQYLPPKTETVIFCRPSELQKKLYNHLLESRAVVDIFSSEMIDASTPLVCISVLRKLCNHPSLLYKIGTDEEGSSNNSMLEYMESAFPPSYQAHAIDSGKMKVLQLMLSSLFSKNHMKEKVVIVSAFTKTLDILEHLCKLQHYEFLRLDGSTNTTSRQGIVDVFNCSYTKFNVFLLSSKAGGVGFNLIGASRIILYDIDWNPANDLQAMARIWRDGQKHKVYVYRMLTTGTIEEKMYQRQLLKQCLSGSVLDASSSGKLRFSKEELMDLFTFHEKTRCITHDLINCPCLSLDYMLNMEDDFKSLENSDSGEKTKNKGMAELMNWIHVCGPISSDNCSDSCLVEGGSDITFLFQNTVNASKKL